MLSSKMKQLKQFRIEGELSQQCWVITQLPNKDVTE